MHIKKMEIKGFGKFNELNLSLTKGLNIIFGDNESGKSTLQWFIRAMFFGLKGGRAAKDGTLPPLKKLKPWKGQDYGGSMECGLSNGGILRIGRNFNTASTRVFDGLFNDITSSYEVSKERGILFGERHLNMSESCFERTLFIRQMQSRVDDEGSKELINRLTNLSETGTEDLSLKKAQEALRDALKNYVGNEKTSTRPMDKLLSRLLELKNRRAELIEKRSSMFETERNYKELAGTINSLEKRESVFIMLQELLEKRSKIINNKKIITELKVILESILSEESELEKVKKCLNDYERELRELERYSSFDSEDMDILDSEFSILTILNGERASMDRELGQLKVQLDGLEMELEPLKMFRTMDLEKVEGISLVKREIDVLREQRKNCDTALLDEKIKSSVERNKLYKWQGLLSGVIMLIFGGLGFRTSTVWYVASMAALVLTGILAFIARKEAKRAKILIDEKTNQFLKANSIIQEINQKEALITRVLSSAEVGDIEEFLRLKSDFQIKSKQFEKIAADIDSLKNKLQHTRQSILMTENRIKEKLIKAGVIDTFEISPTLEHMRSLKNGFRGYKGIEPSIKYASQRQLDVEANLLQQYKTSSMLAGKSFGCKEEIEAYVGELEEGTKISEEEVWAYSDKVKKENLHDVISGEYLSWLDNNLVEENIQDLSLLLERNREYIRTELREVELKTKELETILSGSAADDEELQKIDEEIDELEVKKGRLEDINISLKTALEILNEAGLEIQRDFAPLLNNKMSRVIGRISSGKYNDLRADDRLELKTIDARLGDIVSTSSLSGGTIDQMYLSLRIAMAEMFESHGETLPFMMDEVFAHYDDNRTTEAFKLLEEFSQERQVVFFTCKGREVDIAKDVCGAETNLIQL